MARTPHINIYRTTNWGITPPTFRAVIKGANGRTVAELPGPLNDRRTVIKALVFLGFDVQGDLAYRGSDDARFEIRDHR